MLRHACVFMSRPPAAAEGIIARTCASGQLGVALKHTMIRSSSLLGIVLAHDHDSMDA